MRYEIYTAEGNIGTEKSLKRAMKRVSHVGKFAFLVKDTRFSYPHLAYAGDTGICLRATCLLYPPGAKCQTYTPESFLTEAGVSK